MERFEHGGNAGAHHGVLDYSANLSPLGMPKSAKKALAESIEGFEVYPDPNASALQAAIAEFEGVPASWVLPCAGATDAITRACFARAPRRALVCAPCYSGYEQALEQSGAHIVRHALREDDDFAVTERIADDIDEYIDLVFLANPNNPTGALLERNVLEAVLRAAGQVGATVVLDECFVDLSPATGSNDLLGGHGELIIIKAFTKTFALAGLRVGYALCSNESRIEGMRRAGQPWAVSTPAQVAGLAALDEDGYVQQAKALVAHERARLVASLQAHGARVVDGCANYILFKAPPEAENPYDAFLKRGILVRPCENYVGLGSGWLRIAVRGPQDNDRFLAVLEEVFE